MNVEVAKRAISVDEYYKMAQVGILKPSDKVELIYGEIIEMSPVGSEHASIVNRLARILNERLSEVATLGVQNPVHLDNNSEPEPDIAVLKYRADDYVSSHPQPKDILLIIEVSDTTYQYDKEVKSQLYAKSHIPEYWIIDIERSRIEVYSDSDGLEYLKKEVLYAENNLRLLDKEVSCAEILGSKLN